MKWDKFNHSSEYRGSLPFKQPDGSIKHKPQHYNFPKEYEGIGIDV